eukprot:XP_001697489.1 predicted protein [Chlamydomonas reinhardtii]
MSSRRVDPKARSHLNEAAATGRRRAQVQEQSSRQRDVALRSRRLLAELYQPADAAIAGGAVTTLGALLQQGPALLPPDTARRAAWSLELLASSGPEAAKAVGAVAPVLVSRLTAAVGTVLTAMSAGSICDEPLPATPAHTPAHTLNGPSAWNPELQGAMLAAEPPLVRCCCTGVWALGMMVRGRQKESLLNQGGDDGSDPAAAEAAQPLHQALLPLLMALSNIGAEPGTALLLLAEMQAGAGAGVAGGAGGDSGGPGPGTVDTLRSLGVRGGPGGDEQGVVAAFLALLRSPDADAVHAGLRFVSLVLGGLRRGPQLVESLDGIDALEAVQYGTSGCRVPELQGWAEELVDLYYGEGYGEDEDEDEREGRRLCW